MIRVTVELVKSGNGEVVHLGTAIICNDATGTKTSGNYLACLSKWGSPNAKWKAGEVQSFPRLDFGAWDLLFLSLKSALGVRRIKRLLKRMERDNGN